MNDITNVKFLAKNCTALVVEDSQVLLKQQVNFLSKFFKNVYTAVDGQEGLDKYFEHYPDIVFTDLNMPKLNGHDMINEILRANPQAQIIIISAHTDTNTLLDSLHLGVADFIPKPIRSELLLHTLARVLSNIKKEDTNMHAQVSVDEKLNTALDDIKMNKTKLHLMNEYKGIPISHEATLVEFYNNNIELHTTEIQAFLILQKKETIITSEVLSKNIHGTLDHIDKKTNNVVLKSVKFIDTSLHDRRELRVTPDNDFVLVINDSRGKIEPKVLDVSVNAIALEVESVPEDYSVDKKLAISVAIEQKHSSTFNVKSKDYIGIYGKIFRIEKKEKNVMIVLKLDIGKSDQDILSKYIHSRELEIIQELKQKIVK